MRKPGIRAWGAFLLVLGIGLTVFFVWTAGPARIWAMMQEAGWWVVAVAFAHFAYIAVIAMAWRALLHADGARVPFHEIYYYRWVADGSQAILPGPEVAGDVLRGYLLARRSSGVSGPASAAVIIVELTLRLVSLVLFVGMGLILLAVRGDHPVRTVVAGAILAGMLLFLYHAQRRGLLRKLARRIEKQAEQDHWLRFAGNMTTVDGHIERLYGQTGALARTTAWHFAAFIAGTAEIWLLLYAVGSVVGPLDAIVFETIGKAATNAGFFMPAGLGAQEGGYLFGSRLIGLAAAIGVAVSLLKRLRDVLVGLPALGMLWFRETRTAEDRAELEEVTAARPL